MKSGAQRITGLILSTTVLLALGCKKDKVEPTPIVPGNGGTSYTIPSTYVFTDDNNNNTVSFSGQQIRLEMLSEMVTYMKTANTAGTGLNATQLKDMYANNGITWNDAPGLGLTGTTKQLKSKTAYFTADGSPDAGVQAMFETFMDSIANLSNATTVGNEDGAPGVGGVWPNDGVKGPYLMSGKGIEYGQWIEKGLMCAVFMSQMTVHYLGTVDDDDNTTAVDPGAGKHYTSMEHHWDEAYGYFTSEIDYPANGTNRFWGKYANSRESVLGSATTIVEAFRKGRAAISNDDYTTRDAQITIIRSEMEKVCAGTSIHYLNDAKSNIASSTARNHFLSEATAFLNGLRFGYNAISGDGMTIAEIDTALTMIGEDFNNITITDLQNAIDYIASKTGLTSVKDIL